MKTTIYIFLWLLPALLACSQDKKSATSGQPATAASMKFNKLTPEEERVIVYKGTEMPFTGKYNNYFEKGTYVCKRCGASLFRSSDKFKSECGWPSFDDAIPGAIKRIPDADGVRTEIECASCGAHLGHVFFGEEFTPKDERNCVNSVSLNFVPDSKIANPSIATDPQPAADPKYDTAIFAGGCFWGVEYFMKKAPGVVSTEVGYTGGNVRNPSY